MNRDDAYTVQADPTHSVFNINTLNIYFQLMGIKNRQKYYNFNANPMNTKTQKVKLLKIDIPKIDSKLGYE